MNFIALCIINITYMKRLHFIFVTIVFINTLLLKAQDDCVIVLSNTWGKPCAQCAGSTDAKVLILKNTCSYSIDITCGLERMSGEWKFFERNNLAAGDTMMLYVCDSPRSKHKFDFRKSGTNLPLSACEDYNKEYTAKTGLKPCDNKVVQSAPKAIGKPPVDLSAKLLHGEKQNPLSNQKVNLKNDQGVQLQSTTTDEYGDFIFKQVDASQKITMELDKNPALSPSEKVFLARQDGLVIGEFSKDKTLTFKYELLEADVNQLSEIKVEDTFDKMKEFKKSGKKELLVTQSIYYAPQSYALTEEAKISIDKTIALLKEDPTLTMEVMSHCDSNGDDMLNMKLSQQRADEVVKYITSKGVDVKRVSGKGFGESKLLNRCGNGVKCSEKEHQLNRRTEFRFVKN